MAVGFKRYVVCGAMVISFALFAVNTMAQSNLSVYTGRYKRDVKGYQAYLDVFVNNGKLKAKQSWDGKTKTLKYLGDNKFIISMYGWAVKFARNKQNKPVGMEVLGREIWIKVQ